MPASTHHETTPPSTLPEISVVVVVFNMRREAMRTLQSLALPYQQGIAPDAFEVIVVENGSTAPLDAAAVEAFGPQFRYFFRNFDSISPAKAANFGVSQARGRYVGTIVDGARLASPGLLAYALRALRIGQRPVVATLAWHLGPDLQWLSMPSGYDQQTEDRLLEKSNWLGEGYNLFSISALAGSSKDGYFQTPAESSALFMPRDLHEELGGYEEGFASAGGGLVAGDFFIRACAAPQSELFMLLGEGTFHQVHGGASTNSTGEARQARLRVYGDEYFALRGRNFARPDKPAIYLGALPPQAHSVLAHSTARPRHGAARGIPGSHPIPILFCIDSENDDFDPARQDAKRWASVEACFEKLEPYRRDLATATGHAVEFTWTVRVDPQLGDIYGDVGYGLRTYARQWQEFLAAGDDVGVHPHPQRWSREHGGWVGGQSDPAWTVALAEEAHRAYTKIFGRAPETFRFGNRYMGQELATALEALGFKHDLTLEPGYPGRSGTLPAHRVPGFCPDYFGVPRAPYRSRRDDFTKPDDGRASGLWFVPMSTAPASKSMPMGVGPHYQAFAPEVFPYETLMLRLPPDFFRRAVDHLLHERERPYLAVVIRNDMIHLPAVWANLEMLRTHPLASRFVFAKAATLLALLG